MNNRITFLAVFLLLLAQPATALALAGGPTLIAQSNATSLAVDGQFTVTVQMDTKTYNVTAAELHVTFPSSQLQVLSVQAGTLLPSVLVVGATESGVASITVGSGITPAHGVGSVAVVTFRALVAGTAQIGFNASTQVSAVGQTSNVVDTMMPASITITAASAGGSTPTPYYTQTPAPTSISSIAQVQTGPDNTTILALIVACIAGLLYVGYTRTNTFRRNEAKSYADEASKNPPDFLP